ncbi:hypothetical protein D3C85_1222020 [compost metagenome]
MMFAGAGQRDIAHGHHFINLHLVFDDGDFWEVGVIQAGENLIDIHFCNAIRRFHQAVIAQIEIQQLHDLGHVPGNKTFACFFVQFINGRTQRGFKTTRD